VIQALIQRMKNIGTADGQRWKQEAPPHVFKLRCRRSKKLLCAVAEKNRVARMRVRKTADQTRRINTDARELITDTVTCIESDAHPQT
jgi:hypothetical protein